MRWIFTTENCDSFMIYDLYVDRINANIKDIETLKERVEFGWTIGCSNKNKEKAFTDWVKAKLNT